MKIDENKKIKASVRMMTTFSGDAYKGQRMPALLKELYQRDLLSEAYGLWNELDESIYSADELLIIKRSKLMRAAFGVALKINKKFKLFSSNYMLFESIYSFFSMFVKAKGKIVVLKPRPYSLIKRYSNKGKVVLIEASENHTRFTNRMLLEECKRLNVPVPSNPYTDEKAILDYEKSIDSADYIVCLSSFSKKTYVEMGIPEERITVIQPTVICPNIDLTKLTDLELQFVCVGYHGLLKGTHRLIKCWIDNNIKNDLVIIGSLYDDFKSYCSNFSLPDNIIFLGSKSREWILEYLSTHKAVGVLLSLSEAFGRAAYEYLCCGVPVIVTPTCISDLICEGQNGFVVPENNDEQLYECINRYLLMSEVDFHTMRENALKTAIDYSKHSFENDYANLIEKISNEL